MVNEFGTNQHANKAECHRIRALAKPLLSPSLLACKHVTQNDRPSFPPINQKACARLLFGLSFEKEFLRRVLLHFTFTCTQ
jgi:hypothetical protein